mmetsp:Transcript_2089/g.3331  ORF Transcript_2089/g.3331 Transcript_2089/m.3331 type:complete len:141 (-) Transcript_2089:1313-1735(-)
MPVLFVTTNSTASLEAKTQLCSALTHGVGEILRVPNGHVHIVINDGQFLAFGGDHLTPAGLVTVQAATLQIREENRKVLCDMIMPLLANTYSISSHRTTTFFQEFPVENIAVGNQVMLFSKPSLDDPAPQGSPRVSMQKA